MAKTDKPGGKKAGRPSVITEETVQKLEEAFRIDATTDEACRYAGIARSTYYDWYGKDKNFRTKMDSAQDYLFLLAKRNWTEAIQNKDKAASMDYLKRRQRDRYAEKTVSENDNTNTNFNVELTAEEREALESALGEIGSKKVPSE
jgi:cob(I)alamin adenosyltransferase